MDKYFWKSIQHNMGVLFVGFFFAFLGSFLDPVFGFVNFQSLPFFFIGLLFLAIGFSIRVWATYYFYKHKMKVIFLKPQHKLITGGPYKYSRNPLYLGGNVYIFFGSAFVLGSLGAVIIFFLGLFATDYMIRREEKQLEHKFGKEWLAYSKKVRRWI